MATMKTPLIVTHPATLLHDGLRQTFAKSQFGPLSIASNLSDELESQMRASESCMWLIGVQRYDAATDQLLRRVTASAPGVKGVILAAHYAPEDMAAALNAGACGFLSQDIPAEQLLAALELIALGQAVVHRDSRLAQTASGPTPADGTKPRGILPTTSIDSPRDPAIAADVETLESEIAANLSRRELLVLRGLTEGASNKVIALKLVITESTVKVHMKAILRKLRLQNRTQVAMWARNHIGEAVWSSLSDPARYTGRATQHSPELLPSLAC